MPILAALYHGYRTRISLRRFMKLVGQPYWRLRDYLQDRRQRGQQVAAYRGAGAWVQAVAAAEPTYGYRRVHAVLRQQHRPMGRERVRQLMGALGWQPAMPLKKKRLAPTVTAERDGPSGRRLPIDATRLRLDDGIAWVYRVEDVKTRHCVAAKALPALSQERAAATLLEGHQQLTALGLAGPRLIHSDAGSDFTSGHFQHVCQNIGQWIRCRVAQVGGMGILEPLKRTFKHEFIFRHEVNTLADLQALLPVFQRWYNQRRLHSHLDYRTPAAVLAQEVAIRS